MLKRHYSPLRCLNNYISLSRVIDIVVTINARGCIVIAFRFGIAKKRQRCGFVRIATILSPHHAVGYSNERQLFVQ